MRVLYLFCERFGLDTHRKGVESAPDDERSVRLENVVVCLVHSEVGDDNDTTTKLIKHAKWVARKFESKRIVLHYFSHLSDAPADHSISQEIMRSAHSRLLEAGYESHLMPYGYFCRLDFGVHGESMAKIFKVL